MRQAITAVLGAAALSIACAPAALAADMPVKARVAPPVMGPSWTGCYVGANAGGGWAREDRIFTSTNGVPAVPLVPLGSQTASGLAAGGQIGCDYQFNNQWVVGVRGMWDWSNLKGSNFSPVPNVGNNVDEFNNTKVKSFGTVTARVGFLASPAVMLYGLGGVAWSQNHYTITAASAGGELQTGDQTRIGYDIGAGVSWMIAPNWDLWLEYDHMGFGTKNVLLTGELALTGLNVGVDIKENIDKVLVGVNYRFSMGH
jgi:outer membrane immunogenic protein